MNQKGDQTKKRSAPREHLTLFGEWFYFAIDYLNVSIDDIAERTGYKEATLSRATRDSPTTRTIRPNRAMVKKIITAFQEIAREKDMLWGQPLNIRIMHAAEHATDEEIATAREVLDILRSQK